ncbi:MAG: hypothetical protein GWN00_29015 [Aliifodinibius sp.]|nr:hypothetical protein [Fodinibius sp.]NIV14815.1 hypothetical protein [Fodinibius sp.]NIY28694.1 hypothetical protein [Fodinibius sp.]
MVNSTRVHGKDITIRGRLIKTARIKDEWNQDVEDPESFIKALKQNQVKADLFTFWQRPLETRPKYDYYLEWDPVAVIPIKSYTYWFEKQINKGARRAIKRAKRKGVEVKVVKFNDELIKGITAIYNETPIRQGKPFPHYGKDFDNVRKQNSTYLDQSDFIGVYYKNELIGFIKLTYMESYADPMQIISKIQHRDKAPTNVLLAKAMEICDQKRIPYLFYGAWDTGGLGDFKRHNGFEKIDLPRYYIPLTLKGKIILKLNLHHGIRGMLPEKLIDHLVNLRSKWYSIKYGSVKNV